MKQYVYKSVCARRFTATGGRGRPRPSDMYLFGRRLQLRRLLMPTVGNLLHCTMYRSTVPSMHGSYRSIGDDDTIYLASTTTRSDDDVRAQEEEKGAS